jgi:hypothetical protein
MNRTPVALAGDEDNEESKTGRDFLSRLIEYELHDFQGFSKRKIKKK